MIIWIDAQISPVISKWITENYSITARAVRDIGLREASDERIFTQAGKESVVVMTKDFDFVHLLEKKGPPPKIIWITCGNTSNKYLKKVLKKTLDKAIKLLNSGEDIVEISDIV